MTTAAKSKDNIFTALLAVQTEAPTLQKSAINPHFKSKFVPLDKVHEAVMPLLSKHGLAWTTLPGVTENGNPTLTYILVHATTGSELRGEMALLPPKSDPQGQGSAITYARRYALMAVLGLVADEDDDGNKASKGRSSKAGATTTPGGPTEEKEAGTGERALGSLSDGELEAATNGTVILDHDQQKDLWNQAKAAGVSAKQWKAKMAALGCTAEKFPASAADEIFAWVEEIAAKKGTDA